MFRSCLFLNGGSEELHDTVDDGMLISKIVSNSQPVHFVLGCSQVFGTQKANFCER